MEITPSNSLDLHLHEENRDSYIIDIHIFIHQGTLSYFQEKKGWMFNNRREMGFRSESFVHNVIYFQVKQVKKKRKTVNIFVFHSFA